MTATLHPAVERADLLIDLKRCEEARELLAGRLAEDPEDIRAWVELARSHLGDEKDGAKALEATEQALALDAEDIGALTMHAHALRRAGRFPETEGVLREVIRLAPDNWHGYALLANWLWRIRWIRSGQANGGTARREDMAVGLREADALAQEAIRLAPEEVYAYEVALLIAEMSGDRTAVDQLDEIILRLDPQHEEALTRRTKQAATAPGVKATQAATLYADALASTPGSAPMRRGLDEASYRLLRGIRWLALLCLAFAAVGIDLFATEGETQRELPLVLGQRLWDLVPMAVCLGPGCSAAIPAPARRDSGQPALTRPAPSLAPCGPRPSGVGHALCPADHPDPVDTTHGPPCAVLGRHGADGGDALVRPEEDPLSQTAPRLGPSRCFVSSWRWLTRRPGRVPQATSNAPRGSAASSP
ncbi:MULTISPECIES: tetratricopeptide repeat protein [Streptomyces]|uniref:Tetratricopeptide repeat protein n=1 Tax=Streptomyces flavovirens TaxID=52258 RepID=A0ABV8MXC5_9ACTN|nr:tetratricopeptide repeat protein [Streptomyces sp. MBT51]